MKPGRRENSESVSQWVSESEKQRFGESVSRPVNESMWAGTFVLTAISIVCPLCVFFLVELPGQAGHRLSAGLSGVVMAIENPAIFWRDIFF